MPGTTIWSVAVVGQLPKQTLLAGLVQHCSDYIMVNKLIEGISRIADVEEWGKDVSAGSGRTQGGAQEAGQVVQLKSACL